MKTGWISKIINVFYRYSIHTLPFKKFGVIFVVVVVVVVERNEYIHLEKTKQKKYSKLIRN